jgi:hydrogenase maturation protease
LEHKVDTRCVIGIGCDDHGDQIAGLLVARAVRRFAPEEFIAIESSGAPAEMIAAWAGADSAVVVEAMPGGPPGTVRRCQPHPRELAFGCSSTRLSPRLREALALGPLPDEVTAVTIAAESFVQNAPVTPAVMAAVEEVAGMILSVSFTPALAGR